MSNEPTLTRNLIDEFVDESSEALSNLLNQIRVFLVLQVEVTQPAL